MFCDPPYLPPRNIIATIGIAPLVENGKAFLEWSAKLDCAAQEYDHWDNRLRPANRGRD
jgi:hypothetical protein